MPIAGIVLFGVFIALTFGRGDMHNDGFLRILRLFEGLLHGGYVMPVNDSDIGKTEVIKDVHLQ